MSELFSDNPGLRVEHISDRSVAVLDRDRLARQPAAGRIWKVVGFFNEWYGVGGGWYW